MKLSLPNMRAGWMTICLVLLSVSITMAQRTISGKVTDAETGEGLISASVEVKGADVGTFTDFDGNYTLTVPAGFETIVYSYTGYADQEVTLGASNVLDVPLAQGTALNEVVVVGYGAVKREDVTGSVVSLSSEDFNKGIVTNPDQLIQGRVPGVNVINNSGQPGGEATVKIRGNASIRAGANPLYVIDGVPLDGRSARAGLISTDIGNIPSSNPLNFINPQDIESISILKDASAAAIYGSRAANGVIQVTTKKGISNEPQVDFGVTFGTSSILKKYDVLTGDEYRSALNSYGLTGGDDGGNVDAFDEITQSGLLQSYNFSIGAGGDDSRYRISLGYQDEEGIIKETGIKKYNAAINTGFEFLDDRAGIDILMIANHATEEIAPISTNAGFTGNLVAQALQWNPTVELMNGDEFTKNQNNPLVGATTINPLELLAAHDETANTTTILGGISPYFNITDDIQYRYRYGINFGRGLTRGNMRGFVNVQGVEGDGFAGVSNASITNQVHTHTVTYAPEATGNVALNVLLGYEYQEFDRRFDAVAARGFDILDRDNTFNLQNGDQDKYIAVSAADPINEIQSFFGRVNVGIGENLDVTASLRADGSTKFGENNAYGIFPALAAAYDLTDAVGGIFDNLRVRAGWGITGNQEFPAGASQNNFILLQGSGTSQLTFGNPDLQWEESVTANIGLEFALFDYKISGTLEYFNRSTDNLLLDPQAIPPAPPVRVWQNIDGEVVNSGLEVALNAFVIENDNTSLNVGVNAAFLSNEARGINPIGAGQLFGQGISNTLVQTIEDGQPLNTFYTREFTGLDADGNSTFSNESAPQYLGDPNADVILGITTDLRVGDFNFIMNWNGAFGHQLYNNTANSVIPIGNLGTRNIDAALLEGGQMESTANPIAASSRYIEDGDFIKLANAGIGYNLGELGAFKNVNISLTGQNLLVLTSYTGFDPEVNTVNLRNGVPSSGIEYIPFPSRRQMAINIGFSF